MIESATERRDRRKLRRAAASTPQSPAAFTPAWGGERDHFDISSLGVTRATFASAVHITDTAAGAQISVGDTQVTVVGMHVSSFNASDFLLA